MTHRLPLAGLRVLVVEDEFFQAREVKNVLEEAGAMVLGPVAGVAEAEELIERKSPDAAVIDINLEGQAHFSIATRLHGKGTPFLFLTGYDRHVIPEELLGVPRLEKPTSARRLVSEVAQALQIAA
jgi:DNA-binding response OmpR family regulator